MNSSANDLVTLLQQLIRIPSPNPPGNSLAIAEFCDAFLRNAGFSTTLASPDDRAWSVVGILGSADTPSLLYHAHIDTVPLGQNARWSVIHLAVWWPTAVFTGWAASTTKHRWPQCC